MSQIVEAQIKRKQITVHFLGAEEYDRAYEQHGVADWNWYTHIVQARGFATGNHIYVKEDALGPRRLLAHEIGHILGYDHTSWWMPTTMNQTGLLRWYDKEGLLEYADKVLERV